ncbi:non-heme iron oxygenase ferredoxin subunit [Ornithinimicrobium sp. F0845]|uniref:non-heme iron oxygenase ferredoxin subunit n=1 Tax=Ornithinimicrobium sp. F0845 TaxID=2926412 RepID=UPI001FF65E9C|nr:non-heme iron oxygenase ferredoxin subunit [Ornithinimicrobium sp. F0845]MCK0113775.1 non-heme iron oxygenase ferredoxin subunit [Ornithinimicrobium sp. F0845]
MTESLRTGDLGQQSFVRVCTLADLPEVGAVQASFDGRLVAVARDSSGRVHAFDDTCTHANVSLSEGDVEGHTVECWLHGSRFDMTTGEPTGLPATQPIAIHTVKIEGEDVLVALSD